MTNAVDTGRKRRIALYYPWIYLTSGSERTIVRLTQNSRHDWTLLTNHFEPNSTYPEFKDCKVVELPEVSVERSIGATAKSALKLAMQKLPLDDIDALVVMCEGLGDLVLFRNHDKPALCLCLTPLRIAFDPLYQKRWSEKFSPLKRLAVLAGSTMFRWVDQFAWRHYEKVFCISSEVKKRAIAGGLADADRLEVLNVPIGIQPDPAQVNPVYGDFFLIAGRIMWTKNIELGMEAFRLFQQQNPDLKHFRLLVAGIVDKKSEGYFTKLKESAGAGVEFRVFPSDAELSELYRTCRATLFTAFNEDYGIVPLEAMAQVKTVIAVNQGGPRDTIQHEKNGFLEEAEPARFAQRMTELARSESLARSMGAAGLEHTRNFTWTEFARKIDDSLDAMIQARAAVQPDRAAGIAQQSNVRPSGSYNGRG